MDIGLAAAECPRRFSLLSVMLLALAFWCSSCAVVDGLGEYALGDFSRKQVATPRPAPSQSSQLYFVFRRQNQWFIKADEQEKRLLGEIKQAVISPNARLVACWRRADSRSIEVLDSNTLASQITVSLEPNEGENSGLQEGIDEVFWRRDSQRLVVTRKNIVWLVDLEKYGIASEEAVTRIYLPLSERAYSLSFDANGDRLDFHSLTQVGHVFVSYPAEGSFVELGQALLAEGLSLTSADRYLPHPFEEDVFAFTRPVSLPNQKPDILHALFLVEKDKLRRLGSEKQSYHSPVWSPLGESLFVSIFDTKAKGGMSFLEIDLKSNQVKEIAQGLEHVSVGVGN